MILKVVQACLFLVSSSKCFISCLQMCNIIIYSCSIIRFFFFNYQSRNQARDLGTIFFCYLGYFFYQINFYGYFCCEKCESFKMCLYMWILLVISHVVSAIVSTAFCAIVSAIVITAVSAIVRICTYLYNIIFLKGKVCVIPICSNFSVLFIYYWLWK